MSIHDEYVDVFRDEIGIRSWIPAWRPGGNIRLGDVGRINDGEFTRAYSLTDRGISADLLDVAPPDKDGDEYFGASRDALSVSVKASGKTDAAFQGIAKASVGVKLAFSQESAVALACRDVVERRFQDERAIGDAMVESWEGGPGPKMQLGDLAVTQMLVARWGFIFGAKSSSTSVLLEFAADAQITEGAGLGQIKGKFGVVAEHETDFRAYSPVGREGMVIGYRGLLLRQTGWWLVKTVAQPRWEVSSHDGDADEHVVAFDYPMDE